MSAYISLSSMAMDLKRAAAGYWRGSDKMAQRFWQEALARRTEIDKSSVAPYVSNLLDNMDSLMNSSDKQKIAEDLLLYSILFQNASLRLK